MKLKDPIAKLKRNELSVAARKKVTKEMKTMPKPNRIKK